ncbi:proteic killer suppression protein [Chitinophaga dinghuensis]|uniref:Proteic killer suppression protein n=1 Tax=Chitinophaga dinghuensis TaxID=1539050 RepID=A0A327WBZ7_9BACT|nr:type II toxin-antitoxin system RelE/ParE family toxin [Chitinophaga dinghuensis]RAJ83658.1 proteic killer suppression protein [Chitinophaga dinghuensis]
MILNFRSKALEKLYKTGKSHGLPAQYVRKITVVLQTLNAAREVPKDLKPFPGWKLHLLDKDLKGYWSISIYENWNIIFIFENGNASKIDFIDYH